MIPPALVRRLKLAALALAGTLVAMAWTALGGGPLPAGAPRDRLPREIPFTDVNPYGANFFLEREPDPWKRAKTVSMAQEAGLSWAKQHFPWADIQPVAEGPYLWDKYDGIVDLYRTHGMGVVARLDWSPPWARSDYQPEANNPPDADHVADFAAYAGATAGHFRGRVRFYQIWNEPNLRTEWAGRPVDPQAYVDLLAAAARAIRDADPNAVVLSAPLAITTEPLALAGNLSDLAFLEAMYDAGAAESFDILSANAFGMDRPPADDPAPGVLNMRRIELQRGVMERNGDGGKAVWLNEYGWNAAPADMPAGRLVWRRVTEEQQSTWTVEGVRWGREHWPWVGVFSVWYFQYYRAAPDKAEYYFRMVDLDYTPRRVYAAVRAAARSLEVAGPGQWGEHSAPVTADSSWRWEWAPGATGGNARVADTPGAALTFRFRGESVAVRFLAAPEAGEAVVRIDGRRAGGDSGGGVMLDRGPGGWRWIEVGRDLGPGEHELEVAVAGNEPVAVDAFRVAAPYGLGRVARRMAPWALLAVALFLLLVHDARRALERIPE